MDHHHAHVHDAYYLDQICLIVVSAAFGGICLSLCTWQGAMLHMMLAPFLHGYVLAGGILLVIAALIRAAILWHEAARDSGHEDDHADCEHQCGHAHHDHDWAPWRYVIVLVPIILFLLGLPNKLPELRGDAVAVDLTQEAMSYASLVAASQRPSSAALALGALFAEPAVDIAPTILVSSLAKANLGTREQWLGELVRVEGRFDPTTNPRQFEIERYVRACCIADVQRVSALVVCREPAPAFPVKQWLAVTGRVNFRNSAHGVVTVLEVANMKAIVPGPPQSPLAY
ncbi:MAG: hypothetical protein FJ271_10270 [Planctomycetes bacterium]|nr:hypothetical protein [Planctomycetota bacterium]